MVHPSPAVDRYEPVRGVFLGPMEVAGYFARLRIGLEAIGVRTLYADLEDHPFSYPEAPRPSIPVRAARIAGRRLSSARTRAGRAAWKVASLAARGALLAYAAATCDVFVFGSGQTLFGQRELRLLERLGKRVIIIFFGTDVRPSYLDGIETDAADASPDGLIARTRRKRDRIRRIERHATAIVSHAPMSQLLSREYADWLAIGIPTPPRSAPAPRTAGPLRVLHAPSHGASKGTPQIRDAVERLGAEGVAIDYVELQGVPNEAIADAIASVDVVVDQLYADTPMAVLGSEAAAAGRPTIVGSLDWDSMLDPIPPDRLPPTIRIRPDAIEATLRDLAASPGTLSETGRRAREFVRTRWSPDAVARRVLALADGSAPREWFIAPASVGYLAGFGLTAERLSEVLAGLTPRGDDPFLLGDKPALERRLRSAAGGGEGPSAEDGARAGRLP